MRIEGVRDRSCRKGKETSGTARNKRMDRTESLSKTFLEALGHSDLIYEPDGNIPPDFLLKDGTAVEVRALNQIYHDEKGDVRGLETAHVALRRTMEALLEAYESPIVESTTYGVFYEFSRPIPSRRALERELKVELDQFLSGARDVTRRRKLPCGIGLRLVELGKWKGAPFKLSGIMDSQRGGWVVQQLGVALAHALREKDAKVKPFKEKYPRWWLVLIDEVSWGTDEKTADSYAKAAFLSTHSTKCL